MPGYYIWTIGCQMNKAESDRLGAYFEKAGYTESKKIDDADLIILNTCVVRQSAENKAANKAVSLRALKKVRPDIVIGVTGCLVGPDTAALHKKFPHIDHFFRPGEHPHWLNHEGWETSIPTEVGPTAYVPINQGCNNFCAYCIVPYRRGRERSRVPEEIVAEVRELVNRGVREVTLLGQNVDSYGHDLPETPDLANLLRTVHDIDGLERIRFLTNHPKDMNDNLIEAVASLNKVCKQINLPIQAGDDKVLELMRRGYTVEHYLNLIKKIRAAVPDIALSTDIIVGFPSECDEQFMNTYNLLQEVRYDAVHVAAYSTREGTIAAREMTDDVPLEEKKKRLAMVEKLQEEIATEINAALMGKTVEILVEGRNKGKWQGRTGSDKLVFFTDPGNHLGKLVNIKIEKTSPWSLQGSLVK